MVTLTSAPATLPAISSSKKRVSPDAIALVAVVVAVVIVSLIVFSIVYSTNFNQSKSNSDQGNSMKLNFDSQGGFPKVNVLAQNLIGKIGLIDAITKSF